MIFTFVAVVFAFAVGYLWGSGKLPAVWAWTALAGAGAVSQAEPVVTPVVSQFMM